jgi:thymidylate synthase
MIRAYKTADQAFVETIRECLKDGAHTSPRGAGTREMTSQSLIIHDPRTRIITARDVRHGYCAGLLAWNLGRRNDVAGIKPWNPNASKFSDDGDTVQGENYAQRFWPGLVNALHILKHDPSSRRAWVPVWDQHSEYTMELELSSDSIIHGLDDSASMKSRNVPCCIGFGLRIIQKKLVLQTVMRSQSLYGVFPYDVFLFTALQELIANELGAELGWYEHTMLSAHVYDHELTAAGSLVMPTRVEKMEPLKLTLSEAAFSWPLLLDDLNDAEGYVTDDADYAEALEADDPIEAMLIADWKERNGIVIAG